MIFIIFNRIPFVINIVGGPIFSYAAIVMNILVFISLFDKNIKTPSTILMQGLAIADSLTALCTYGFEPIFHGLYDEIPKTLNVGSSFNVSLDYPVIILKYPYCLLHYCLSNFSDSFHFVSILLTTSLGLQKLLVVVFPFWSKIHIREKSSRILCILCYIGSCVLHIPKMAVVTMTPGKGGVCLVTAISENLNKYVLSYFPIIYLVTVIFCTGAMIVSAVCMIYFLCKRKKVRGHASPSRYERKSCILVSCIVIIFLVSESPRLLMNIALFNKYRPEEDIKNGVRQKAYEQIYQYSFNCFNSYQFEEADSTRIQTEKDACIKYFRILPARVERNTYRNLYEMEEDAIRKSMYLKYYLLLYTKKIFPVILNLLIDWIDNNTDKICAAYNVTYAVQTLHDILDQCQLSTNDALLSLLVSSPYCEPMNHIINIVEDWNISTEHLKIFLEIIKLSTIIGCASNFIIYIIMSEKLRNVVLKRLQFWKVGHSEERDNQLELR